MARTRQEDRQPEGFHLLRRNSCPINAWPVPKLGLPPISARTQQERTQGASSFGTCLAIAGCFVRNPSSLLGGSTSMPALQTTLPQESRGVPQCRPAATANASSEHLGNGFPI